MSETRTHPAVEALQGSITRTNVNFTYRLGLVVVAIAMVLLPVIYIALIVGVAYLIYLYIPEGLELFVQSSGTLFIWRALVFATPIIAGVIVIFFMIKPLFARRGAEMQPLTIDPAEQKDVYDFVHGLCGVVGAPLPRRIDVDCDVNASAAFERGVLGIASGPLILTIGLPLVAGLDLRALAGVLAHELGHFSQGAGMRLSYVIRRVNFWFARVVYERDAWDERLGIWAEGADARVLLILKLTRGLVWLTRRILWALMMVGHGISCFLMRQMEFDADRYQARVSGSQTVESTLLSLHRLGVGAMASLDVLAHAWEEKRLPDDLPQLRVQLAERLSSEDVAKIEEELADSKTGFFDTHPAEADRIAHARLEPGAGLIHVEGPATSLFREFEQLSRSATLRYYEDVVGDEADEARLLSVAAILETHTYVRDQMAAFERNFLDGVSMLHPLWLPSAIEPTPDDRAACHRVRDAKIAMNERSLDGKGALETISSAETQRFQALTARALLVAQMPIDAPSFGLEWADLDSADKVIADAEQTQNENAPRVEAYHETARVWLSTALGLLGHPQVAQHLDCTGPATQVGPLLRALSSLRDGHKTYLSLREPLYVLAIIIQNAGRPVGNLAAVKRLMASRLRDGLLDLREQLSAPYPFEHAGGPIRIGTLVVGDEMASASDVDALCYQAAQAQDRYGQLYVRVLGGLILAAEALERAADVESTPALPTDERSVP